MQQYARNLEAEQIDEAIDNAMRRAFKFFSPSENGAPKGLAMAERLGLDKDMLGLRPYALEYRINREFAFGLSGEFSLEIFSDSDSGIDVVCKVSWPSGGGRAYEAVAQASLHLEMAQKAAQCQMAVESALSRIRISCASDNAAFREGVTRYLAIVEATRDELSKEWKKVEKEEKHAIAQNSGAR